MVKFLKALAGKIGFAMPAHCEIAEYTQFNGNGNGNGNGNALITSENGRYTFTISKQSS